MMITWYQPTEIYNKKRLIHLCIDNPRSTLCGLKINNNWIIWDWKNETITCKKCQKLNKK
jgi:hypothetical protein